MKSKSKNICKIIMLFIIVLLLIMLFEMYKKKEGFNSSNNTVTCPQPSAIKTCGMLDSTNSSCCDGAITTSGQSCVWKQTYDHEGNLIKNSKGGFSCQSTN
jgi:hypothetical protein